MATLNLSILEAAYSDGLLPKRLSRNQKLYLHPSVLTANEIYWSIADGEGVDYDQLERAIGLNQNTLKQYTRFLLANELVYAEIIEHRRYILYTQRRHKIARTENPTR